MKKFCAAVCFMLLLVSWASASHIVGGEMGVEEKGNNNFRVFMNLYYDVIGATEGTDDPVAKVTIFQKSNNESIADLTLQRISSTPVQYSNPVCAISDLQTNLIIYDAEIYLDPGKYNHPGGYYVSWQRCCRNDIINNIIFPGGTGMVFYAEFPPVIFNNTLFRNSSPVFKPIKGDYLCQGQEYSISFAATDKDGDRLVYSLTNPLRGTSTQSNPVPEGVSGLYQPVQWESGFTANNAVPGASPSFNINSETGLLKVRPTIVGLFVFSVKVEEYRNNQKIGEVRRDFQWKVIACEVNAPPKLTLQLPDGSTYIQGDTIVVTATENSCFKLLGTDTKDSRLNFSILPVNYTQPEIPLTPPSGNVTEDNVPVESSFCWSDCSFARDVPYIFDVLVSDDGCPLPLTSRLQVTLLIKPEPNEAPVISTSLPGNVVYLTIGDSVLFDVTGNDADNDLITLSYEGTDFDPSSLGMQFNGGSEEGSITEPFYWKPDCSILNREQPLKVTFRAKDNSCFSQNADTTSVLFYVQDIDNKEAEFLPPNVFTPNGDGINDVFAFPTLPLNNCAGQLNKIEVFNRWGKRVFEGNSRSASWEGSNVPDGVYYYLISFSNRTYKGIVSILR